MLNKKPAIFASIICLLHAGFIFIVHASKKEEYNGRPTAGKRKLLLQKSLKRHFINLATSHKHSNFNDLAAKSFAAYIHPEVQRSTHNNLPDRVHSLHASLPPFPETLKQTNRELVRDMFRFAYDSYMYHAYPAAEIHPISCTPGTFDLVRIQALTLIDSLDMLIILGNHTEFARSVERLRDLGPIFAVDQNVSVFETNIRILGGLLSAHQMAEQLPAILHADVFDGTSVRWGDREVVQEKEQSLPPSPVLLDQYDYCPARSNLALSCHEVSAVVGVSLSPRACAQQQFPVPFSPRNSTSRQQSDRLWIYDDYLLELALDIGERLLPAFDTKTGVPYGTVNLLYGVPPGETTIASLAGGGTLTLEFELLSRLTGDDRFGKAAKLASRAIFLRKSSLDLFGKHIDVQHGHWTETLSGVGSNSDSYFEYLAKHYFLFPEDEDFWSAFVVAYSGVFENSRAGEWYVDVDMNQGSSRGHVRRVLESLMAFYPGMQVLLGENVPAARTLNSFLMVREYLGFLPERFLFQNWKVDVGRGAGKHPLRPELLESVYFVHRATKDISVGSRVQNHGQPSAQDSSGWLWAADFALNKLEQLTKTHCGYASPVNLSPESSGLVEDKMEDLKYMDEMPSFFLSETLKYLYLTFDDDNFVHKDEDSHWVFTTEAHPIHSVRRKSQDELHDDILQLQSILETKLHLRNATLSPDDLNYEKWTVESTQHAYLKEIGTSTTMIPEDRQAGGFFFDCDLVSPLVADKESFILSPHDTLFDNYANLGMSNLGLGAGTRLKKACPNVYSSDLLWLHALNGGSMDYADVYVSVAQDDLSTHPNYISPIGAAEALGILGRGVFDISYDKDRSCPAPDAKQVDDQPAVPPDFEEGEAIEKGPIQVATGMGRFEIQTFPKGDGFFIQLLENGESIVTTFLQNHDSEPSSLVMVYATIPVEDSHEQDESEQGKKSSWQRVGSQLNSILHRRKKKKIEVDPTAMEERRIVVADLDGNSYSCDVEVVEKFVDYDDAGPDAAEKEEVLARYPCAPASFGLTGVEVLAKSGGICIEAPVINPREGDENGCMHDSTEEFPIDYTRYSGWIQVLRRGNCSFYTKAVNQRFRWNADAVIVINDDPHEVFIMSDGGEGELRMDPNRVPVSVLVAGLDGEDLLDKLKTDADDEAARIVARLSITQQKSTIETRSEKTYWPIVNGSPESILVYAKSGWGVSAKPNNQGVWELQLLQHSITDKS